MTKPSVILDLPEWPGWDTMDKLREKTSESPYPKDSENALVTLMQTGCRRGEAVTIKKDQVQWNDEVIVCKRVPVTKYRSAMVRDIIIPRDEGNPWGDLFVEYVESLDHEYLFPAHTKRFRTRIPHKHTTGRTLYNRIAEIDSSLLLEDRDMWPHGVRGLCASMLVAERDFTVQMLMKWFEWTHPGMAIHYTRTRDLAKAMGIKNLP